MGSGDEGRAKPHGSTGHRNPAIAIHGRGWLVDRKFNLCSVRLVQRLAIEFGLGKAIVRGKPLVGKPLGSALKLEVNETEAVAPSLVQVNRDGGDGSGRSPSGRRMAESPNVELRIANAGYRSTGTEGHAVAR